MSVDSVIAGLNDIVRLDGAELRVRARTESSLHLELDLADSECPECVVPNAMMLDILRSNLATADPDIQRIELDDPREP